MTGLKPWYLSRGIWGAVIAIAALFAGRFGVAISEPQTQELTRALMDATASVGALVALFGRVWASRKIG